jgi:mono/diheme cytochrome c family protein
MKKNLVFLVFGMLLATVLLAQSAVASEYDLGEKLYSDKCHICHGKRGDGKGPGGVAFNPPPANFTNPKFWQGDVHKKISDTIQNGHAPMPAFDLPRDQIKAIIYYMEHTFKKERKE